MDKVVLLSLIVRLAATVWSVILLKRQKNWRFGLLTFTLGYLFSAQFFNAVGIASVFWQSSVIQDLLISIFSLMAVAALSQAIEHRKRLEEVEKKS